MLARRECSREALCRWARNSPGRRRTLWVRFLHRVDELNQPQILTAGGETLAKVKNINLIKTVRREKGRERENKSWVGGIGLLAKRKTKGST